MSLRELKEALERFPKWNPYACESDKQQFLNRVFGWFEDFQGRFNVLDKKLRDLYTKLCETRIHDIGADNKCFLIEDLFDAEAEEILSKEVF